MGKKIKEEFLEELLDNSYFKEMVYGKIKDHELILKEFRDTTPERRRIIDKAIKILLSQKFNIDKEVEDDFSEIYGKIFDTNDNGDQSRETVLIPTYNKFFYLVASIVVIVGILYGIFNYYRIPDTKYTTTEIGQFDKITKSNPRGRKSFISLPDGSKVILNSESSITYPRSFNSNNRTVELVGEAFFEVTEDHARPFVVLTGKLSTTALGTSFNIRHFQNEDKSYISLVTGKILVKVSNGQDNAGDVLVPGEQIISSKDKIQLRKINYNYKEVLLWKEKVIYFSNADWEKIVNVLERWYGVTIHEKGLKKSINYTGQFEDQSLENVLHSMGYTLGFEHSMDNSSNTIQIIFNNN